jgi:hypothetical protein
MAQNRRGQEMGRLSFLLCLLCSACSQNGTNSQSPGSDPCKEDPSICQSIQLCDLPGQPCVLSNGSGPDGGNADGGAVDGGGVDAGGADLGALS